MEVRPKNGWLLAQLLGGTLLHNIDVDAPYSLATVIELHGHGVACGYTVIALTRLWGCTVIRFHGYCVATVMWLHSLRNTVILLEHGYATHVFLYKIV